MHTLHTNTEAGMMHVPNNYDKSKSQDNDTSPMRKQLQKIGNTNGIKAKTESNNTICTNGINIIG